MNKKNLNLINKFANETSIAKGGNMHVVIEDTCTSFKPSAMIEGMKFEDCNYLADLIKGATQFIFFLEREGYTISKRKNK